MNFHRKIPALFACFACFALVFVLWISWTAPAHAQEKPPPPEIDAASWVVTDLRSGETLAGENAEEPLATGSTSKMMTVITALKMVENGEASLDDEVTVSGGAAAFAIPLYSNAGLAAGDVLSVRELLIATIVPSGGDAAYALAEHLGGGEGQRSVDRYVQRMNDLAPELGLEESSFENVIGLDARDHRSSASDLARMARAGFEYPLFREIVGMQYATISTPEREIPLTTENDLLFSYPLATGVKTGTTPAAGPSLVASAADGNESYIATVLGSNGDRYADALSMFEYAFAAYDRPTLVAEGERYTEVDAPYRRDERVPLVAARDVAGLVDASSEVEREVSVMDELPDSARRGDRLGEIVLEIDGERVGESPLVAGRAYDEAPIWQRAWFSISGVWQ